MTNLKCLVNPTSGNGAGRKLLQQKLVPTQATDPENICCQLETFVQPHDTLIIAGGDGTVHLLMNALVKTKLYQTVSIALFPLGTGNDLAKALKLPRRNFAQLLQHLKTKPQLSPLAIWSSDKTYFTNYISWGVDAKSLDDVDSWRRHLPKARWLTLLLYAYAGIKNSLTSKRHCFVVNGQEYPLLSLVLTSISSYGGGSKVVNHNQAEQPCLNMIGVQTRWQLIKLMLTRVLGKPYPSTAITTPIQIKQQAKFVQADGEMLNGPIAQIEFCGHIQILCS